MARRPAKAAANKRKIKIEWTGSEKDGGSIRIPEGDYAVEVESVEKEVSKNDNDMLVWKFKGTDGKAKGKTFFYHTVLTPESLWNLAGLLTALGLEVPEEPEEIDLDEMIGLEMMAVIGDDTYQGKTRSKIMDFYAIDDDAASEASASPARSGKGKKATVVKVSADEVNAMDESELQDLIEKCDLEVDLGEYKTPRRRVAAVLAALEEKDLLEEEPEAEPEKPTPRRRR